MSVTAFPGGHQTPTIHRWNQTKSFAALKGFHYLKRHVGYDRMPFTERRIGVKYDVLFVDKEGDNCYQVRVVSPLLVALAENQEEGSSGTSGKLAHAPTPGGQPYHPL